MTDFAQKVYSITRGIPLGKVMTYGQIASILGKPGASQAVGNALHNNPNPSVTPCHRVLNKKGELAKNFGAKKGIITHKKRLEQEGIFIENFKVDLKKFQVPKKEYLL